MPENWKCSSENVIYYLHVKHALNNILGVQKIFGQGLTTINIPTETLWKEKKLNKSHLMPHFAEVNHNSEDD